MAIKETKGDFDFAPIQKNARQIRASIVRQAKSKPSPPQPIVNTIFEQAIARARAAKARAALLDYKYVNRDTGRVYAPHTDAERDLLVSDTPRYLLVRGGEGSGKSVFGTIKDIGKLRRGMNMVIGSPDFVHFSKSLFPEFIRWCPPEIVVEKDQYRLSPTWEPQKQFTMHFHTIYGGISVAYMGGFDEPASWEGANVSAAHFDEARRHKTPAMIKVLDGRVRIAGAAGEPPQFYLTTTPAKHWLYDYFGNIECKCDVCETEFSDTTALTKEQFMKQVCPVCGQ